MYGTRTFRVTQPSFARFQQEAGSLAIFRITIRNHGGVAVSIGDFIIRAGETVEFGSVEAYYLIDMASTRWIDSDVQPHVRAEEGDINLQVTYHYIYE